MEHKYFRKQGVVVLVPPQPQPVLVERLDPPQVEALPGGPVDFQPFRTVIDLKVKLEASPNTYVTQFNPPITIRIRCTHKDVKRAKLFNYLKLGYWDGKKWVHCTAKTHKFQLEVDKTIKYAGWGIIQISNWDDPIPTWGI